MKHQQQRKDSILNKGKLDQVAIKDNPFFTHVDFSVQQELQDPTIILNTARIDAALPEPSRNP